MAVFVTKSMLTNMNTKIKIPSTSRFETLETEPWSTILAQSERGMQLSKEMICRVCGQSACHPLLDMINDQYDIMTAIRSVTHITITVDDSLPKFICTQCLEALKIAIDFKRNCEISDRAFRKIQNPMGDPALHSYPYSKHDFHLILGKMQSKKRKREELKEIGRQKSMKEMKKKCGPKEKQFKCVPCDIVFTDKDKLSEHRRERQCMRRACDICGQLVLSISQHRRLIHRLHAQHKCQHCFKEFPTVARLKAHMLVHTNTFNFFCDMCPYKCKHKYYLVMHMRTHTGEKPYKCPHCPSTFVNPSNLNKHKLTHQEKQFKCALCEKSFRTGPALRDHHEAAHMNIKHSCHYCGRDFCYKSDLRKHEIRSHNRVKRDYVGGEPSYKQIERMQGNEQCKVEDKWRAEFVLDNSAVVQGGAYAHYDTHGGVPQQSVTILTDLSEVEVAKHEFEVPTEVIYF